MKKLLSVIGIFLVFGFILIQLAPFGRNHQNPSVTNPVTWSSAQAEDIARRACYDCHSNETAWPWYSNIAPLSWMIQNHVDEGREHMNFSAWGSNPEGERAEELVESVAESEMPPATYQLQHPKAKLTADERQILMDALRTVGPK